MPFGLCLCFHCLFPAKSPCRVLVQECAAMATSCALAPDQIIWWSSNKPSICTMPNYMLPTVTSKKAAFSNQRLKKSSPWHPTIACFKSWWLIGFIGHYCHIPRSRGPASAWHPIVFLNSLRSADPARGQNLPMEGGICRLTMGGTSKKTGKKHAWLWLMVVHSTKIYQNADE